MELQNHATLLEQNPLPYRVYPGKRIIITIGGKTALLRWTPSQRKRYLAYVKEREEAIAKAETVADRLEMLHLNRVKLLEIALNPCHDKVNYTADDIETLDVNVIGHLATLWADELMNPQLSPLDPALAPLRG